MNWRLIGVLLGLALPGVVVVAWIALPLLIDTNALPAPLIAIQLASAVQSAALVLVAAIIGEKLGRKAGLHAPLLTALIERRPIDAAWRASIAPSLIGGALGAAIITAFYAWAPDALRAMQGNTALPLIARVLYGGITEEVLIRWGLMSFLVWAGWRMFAADSARPSNAVIWLAIATSAVVFGLGHVPAAAASIGTVTLSLITYITIGNTLFGLVAGVLFWRYGLESAILAHSLAHVLAFLVHG